MLRAAARQCWLSGRRHRFGVRTAIPRLMSIGYTPRVSTLSTWIRPKFNDTLMYHLPNIHLCRTLATQAIEKHPLLNLGQFPDFAAIQADQIVPAFDHLLEDIKQSFQQKTFTPSWEGTLGQIEELEDRLGKALGVVTHLKMVKDHAALREAIQVVQPRAVQLSLWMQQSRPLYEALQELRMDAGRWYQLSNVQQRIVEQRLLDMKHAGVGFDPESPEHKRCNEIHQYLTKFSIIFGDNLLDAIKKYGRLVEDKALLAGCSDHLLRILANHAYQRGYGTGDPVTGPWMITLDHQTLDLFMKSCQNRGLREEIYRAHISKAASGAQDNRPLIREILKLRQELAQLFGYASYADMSLSRKMAKDTNSVQQLIDTLYQAAKDAAQKEIRTLTEFAHEKLGLQGDIEPWDLAFVSEQYRKITMDLDEEKLSQYFPFPRVIQGMFALVERLFDITVREVDPQSVGAPSVWHKDVKLYQVSKVGSSQPLAYFYGDFYIRPEEKRPGAWMDMYSTRWLKRDQLCLPVAYLNCNQPAPLSEKETPTMTFTDVLTLFHEFGHCLQHMLTKIDLPQASGVNGIEWDFIEVASQFMENFCYEKETLRELASHVKTGEPLPDELIENLKKKRQFLAGISTLRQLQFAHVDLELHRTPVQDVEDWEFTVDRRVSERYAVTRRIPEDRFLCSFAHIFGGGYSAGYYSYKWSEVYSADAYAAFENVTGAERKAVGQRYRDTVLALGGGVAPQQVWQLFRGRPHADPSALLRHQGLIP